MLKFVEKTDTGLLVISPMRLISPLRFSVQTEQQVKISKTIETLILFPFVLYCLNMYRTGFDGLALLFWSGVAQVSIYLAIWIFVPDVQIYNKSRHEYIKAFHG